MRLAIALFALAAAGIVVVWAWLGSSVEMPQGALGPNEKLPCVSYAPFRAGQDPFGPDVPIDPRQIDEDLAQLKQITSCVRTYSVDHGLDRIPEIAKRHGLKVLQGLWLSSLPDLSRKQVETTIALAKRFPDVVEAVIVGNEVLLRGEMSAPVLAQTIREVKSRIPMPVTYADVWEFWLRYREIAAAVDFITIHILPYWEDFPIPASEAARHVEAIRKEVAAAFPGKDVFVGEFGWPSAGRMREGALPSPVTQARVLQEVVLQARREGYRLNVIEAYDQPWKRRLEGTVGGHWGLFDAYQRRPKFAWGAPVSDHPRWRWQAAAGIALAGLVFAAAWFAPRPEPSRLPYLWPRIAGVAFVPGMLIGLTMENVPLVSLTLGDWARSLAWSAVALLAPVVAAAAITSGSTVPSFMRVLGRATQRPRRPLELALGVLLVLLTVLAVQAALGLVFDPRYRDFPFAPILGAAVPFLLTITVPTRLKLGPAAETLAAGTLALAAIYIVFNETVANWQALWFCVGLIVLAFTLLRVRDAPG